VKAPEKCDAVAFQVQKNLHWEPFQDPELTIEVKKNLLFHRRVWQVQSNRREKRVVPVPWPRLESNERLLQKQSQGEK
jgi:hypothetical protein